jgi:hypothetical protein
MTCSQANKYPFSPRLPCRQQTCSAQVKEPTDLQPQIRVLHFSAAAHRAKMMLWLAGRTGHSSSSTDLANPFGTSIPWGEAMFQPHAALLQPLHRS